jgi:hypothetical protein
MRVHLLAVSLMLLGACGSDAARPASVPVSTAAVTTDGAPSSTSTATPTTALSSTTSAPAGDPCLDPLPFEPTFLPEGFSAELLPGDGGMITIDNTGSVVPIEPLDPNVVHYAGSPGHFINIARSGETAARYDDITVLGQSAQFGEIEDGYVVNFTVDDAACSAYVMLSYGVSADDTKRVAVGLEANA